MLRTADARCCKTPQLAPPRKTLNFETPAEDLIYGCNLWVESTALNGLLGLIEPLLLTMFR
jgi:hypothetical protein